MLVGPSNFQILSSVTPLLSHVATCDRGRNVSPDYESSKRCGFIFSPYMDNIDGLLETLRSSWHLESFKLRPKCTKGPE